MALSDNCGVQTLTLKKAVLVDCTGRQVMLLPGTEIQKVDDQEAVYEVVSKPNHGLRFVVVRPVKEPAETWI